MDVKELKGVGKVRLEALAHAGITEAEQLLWRYPRDYIDYDLRTPIAHLRSGQRVVFAARIKKLSTGRGRGMIFTYATVFDQSGEIKCVWYNQPYRAKTLEIGADHLFVGMVARNKGTLMMVCPQVLPMETCGIRPIYAPLGEISNKVHVNLVQQAWEHVGAQLFDPIPQKLLTRFNLPGLSQSVYALHFPQSMEELSAAMRRLSFEDLLLFRIAMRQIHARSEIGRALKANMAVVQPFVDSLPYELTGAQKRVLQQALDDMGDSTPMARLVEGDVGCGKTVIAFALLYCAYANGVQSAMMAPTEVLAQQHYTEAKRMLEPLGLKVALVTGSVQGRMRAQLNAAIADGSVDVIIGTHALITENMRYKDLGLIVTDEQHRFGVRQRTALEHKGMIAPHVLVMSATPIPRTMALVLYGDLDISVVDELPPGRKEIKTHIVSEKKRTGMYGFLDEAVKGGQQVYVVCPLVEESEVLDVASATQTAETMRKALPDARIELMHGKLKSAEKERILKAFAAHECDILVSTTVIEVGVNVPNATIMVIEDAERFGLAQLHQLRGRVGRGDKQSWCFLMADSSERMKTMASTANGFEIAEKDLEMRGPGEIMGTRQSGMLDAGIMRLAGDPILMEEVGEMIEEIFAEPDAQENRALILYARQEMEKKGLVVARN